MTFVFKMTLLTLALFSTFQAGAMNDAISKQTYEDLPGAELRLQMTSLGAPIVGRDFFQKNNSNGNFCRKSTAPAPGAQTAYDCYTLVANGNDAHAIFMAAPERTLDVLFYKDHSALLGQRWSEKAVSVNRFGPDAILCVETAPVVQKPKSEYACYYPNRHPLGGAVSVGN